MITVEEIRMIVKVHIKAAESAGKRDVALELLEILDAIDAENAEKQARTPPYNASDCVG